MKTILPIITAIALLSNPSAASTILLSNDFGAGADTGPSFQMVQNTSGTRTADTNTGSVSVSGHADAAAGFNTTSTIDVSSYSSFTIEWVVSGASIANAVDINSYGWFFGVTSSTSATGTGLWNNNPSVGILIYGGDAGRGVTWSLAQKGSVANDHSYINLNGSLPSEASVNDGFTVSLTINSNDTWSASSIGLSNNINTSGALVAGKYDALKNNLVANTTIQGNPASYTVDSVTITAVPEPGAAVLGGFGVLFLLARRRRA